MKSKNKIIVGLAVLVVIVSVIFIIKNQVDNNEGNHNYFVLKQNEQFGVIDENGNIVVQPQYDSITIPNKSKDIFICEKNSKYKVIDIKGKKIIKEEYDKILSDNGYEDIGFIVGNKTEEGYRYGYINKDGKQILKNEYNEISRITDIRDNKNIYLISAKNGQYGLTKNGKELTKNEYKSMSYNYDMNLIIVEKSQKFGAINTDGKIIIPTKYNEINVNGRYIYAQDEQGIIVLNSEGNKVDIDTNIYQYNTENENYIIIINNSNEETKYGVIDKNGNEVLEEKYSYIEYAFGNYFIAGNENGKLGIIDDKGNIKLEFNNDTIQRIHGENILQINTGEETKYFDNNGNITSDLPYEINQSDPETIGKYYKVTYGFGEIYYTDEK